MWGSLGIRSQMPQAVNAANAPDLTGKGSGAAVVFGPGKLSGVGGIPCMDACAGQQIEFSGQLP